MPPTGRPLRTRVSGLGHLKSEERLGQALPTPRTPKTAGQGCLFRRRVIYSARPVKEDIDGGIRRSVQGLNRIREIVERLKELQEITYGSTGAAPTAQGTGNELLAVFSSLEQAIPLIEVLTSPFSKREADEIDRSIDDVERFRLLATDLRRHAHTALVAAKFVEEAASGVVALRAKVTERDRLTALGINLGPSIGRETELP